VTEEPMKILHLITQRNQPYGSTRMACENCGEYGRLGNGIHFYTEDPLTYGNRPLPPDIMTCIEARYDPETSRSK